MKDEKENQRSYVYMVRCEDESIYTGITKDVAKRMKEHFFRTDKGAKYTKSRKVKTILMVWEAMNYSSAARLEYAIKHIPKYKKLQLIEAPDEQIKVLFPKLEEEMYISKSEYVMDVVRLFDDKSVDKEGGI